MTFEYDPAKSASNRTKHGLDFDAAQALWADVRLLEVPARTEGEPRFMAIGMIGDRHWSAIFTRRFETIRIISVRRSRQQEIDFYENSAV